MPEGIQGFPELSLVRAEPMTPKSSEGRTSTIVLYKDRLRYSVTPTPTVLGRFIAG